MVILGWRMAILDLMKRVSKTVTAKKQTLPAFVSRQVARSRRYFLDLSTDHQRPIAVACGGYEEVRRDYLISREDFPYYCVEFIAGGVGQLWLGKAATEPSAENATQLSAGTVFSYGPGVPHRMVTDPRQRLRKHYVDFSGRQAVGKLRGVGLEAGTCLRVSHATEVAELFDLMLRCGAPQSVHSDGLCSQLLDVLLAKVKQRRLSGSPHDERAFETYDAFQELLGQRCAEWATVEAACAAFGITPAYACRLFARFGEQSPYQVLIRRRMALAAEWLGNEQLLVKEVAARLGYPDQYQFSRGFKRVFGISPAAYRRGQFGGG